jgi:thioredoxin 1
MKPVDSWDVQVLRAGQPVLVYFGADRCGYCRLLRPRLEELEEEHAEYTFLRVDADRQKDLVRAHRVRGLPTCLIFKHGEESARIVGAEESYVYLGALREPLVRASFPPAGQPYNET